MAKDLNLKLATTYDNDPNTFAGEHAGLYISSALLSGSTLGNEEVTIMPNIRYKSVVSRVNLDDVVKDATCAFSDTSTIELVERVLEPKELQVNLQLCKKEIAAGWEALKMGFSAYREMPETFTDYLLNLVSEKVAEEIEQKIWTGTAATNSFLGWSSNYAANIASVPAGQKFNVATPTAVTAANVVTRLGAMLDGLPAELYGKEDLKFYVSTNVCRAYQRSLGGFASIGTLGTDPTTDTGTTAVSAFGGYQNQSTVGLKPMNFDGIDIVLCPGMAANTMILTQKSNLFFGTGLLNDTNEVRTIDMADVDGSQNYRVIMRFTAGTQIGIIEDSVTDGL